VVLREESSLADNLDKPRATTLAFLNIISQLFAIGGNLSYVDPPLYRHGHAGSLGMTVLTAVMAAATYWWLRRRNRVKAKEQERSSDTERREDWEWDVVGDNHPGMCSFSFFVLWGVGVKRRCVFGDAALMMGLLDFFYTL
jgi:hypothetical protein